MVDAPGSDSTKATPTSRPEQSVVTRSHQLVAGFLASQGYTDTLAAFNREAAAALDGVQLLTPTEASTDLRDVVADFLTSRMHALAIPAPPLEDKLLRLKLETPLPTKITKVIRDGTNVLTVRRGVLPRREWEGASGRFKSELVPAIFTSAVDRTVKVYSSESFELLDTHQFPSPVLSISIHPLHPRIVVAGMMEGSLHLLDLVTREVQQKVKDHTKYIVRTAWSDDGSWVASIGYDRTVNIYQVIEMADVADDSANALLDGEEPDELATLPKLSLVLRHTHECKTNPEALVFLPSSSHLVFTARDDHILHYLKMPSPAGPAEPSDYTLTGYNLNENGDAWVSFSVLYITIHPQLPLLSFQTSTENSRILLYPFHSSQRLLTLFTTAEQSEFTTPRHCWLPDGSAVLVNSEDGVLRVVDIQGKVRARIGAHGAAGPVDESEDAAEGRLERARVRREADRGSSVVKDVAVLERDGKLVFVSCGFDKTVRVVEDSA